MIKAIRISDKTISREGWLPIDSCQNCKVRNSNDGGKFTCGLTGRLLIRKSQIDEMCPLINYEFVREHNAGEIPPKDADIIIKFKDWKMLEHFDILIRSGHKTSNNKFPWFAHGYGALETKDIISWKYRDYL